ncbi:phosphate acetyltransferase [Ilyobacter polytropus]|uniref:Phosphate acetyltransferase n=1 Tax=Ilyobacter polytropus (strain ATCC 51220 / DSM 2926 / LMG 16218 / CuHBu1) TaxID=572544 RepID=E3H6B6_ILYPC|nr:phosphate acetyltransferase [Ilyobacter polytropus]ADO82329.1 phosphotransacetylase [Ilyobacter polytropus DSM 2926]
MSFISEVREKAKSLNNRIVLPESTDERVLKATEEIVKEKLSVPVLIGNAEELTKQAQELGVSLEGAEIIDPINFSKLDEYVAKLVELRSKKGMTEEQAKEILTSDVNFFGAMMVKFGDAAGMVSGSDSPTANVLKAALQVVGTKPGMKTVSSVFLMELKDKIEEYGQLLLFGDCAVIPEPTSEQLADIAASAAETAKSVAGVEPKVALMSFSTKGSARHDSVDVVVEAGKLLTERKVDFDFEAELQADAALVNAVGAKKAPGSKVAGNANILIFPNLAAGNIGYKLVQRLAGAEAHGPLLQGLAAPINDLSRGCSVSDITNLTAITSVQAG